MKCEKCGGRMVVKDSASDEYVKYRKRECCNCRRVIFTSEEEDKGAQYFLSKLRYEQRKTTERREKQE